LARKTEFDLVVLDAGLPEMGGLEVCTWLKQDFRYGRTPVIFVSGHASAEDRRRCFEAGAVDFIPKPFDPFVFVSRVVACVKPAKD